MSRVLLVPKGELSASDIAELRELAPNVGLRDLMRHAAALTPFADYSVFRGDWPVGRDALLAICTRVEKGRAPFTIHIDDGCNPVEEIGPASLRARLEHWRLISEQVERDVEREG